MYRVKTTRKKNNYPQPNPNNQPKHKKSPKIKLSKSKGFSS